MTHLELTKKLLGLAGWSGENMTEYEDAFAAIEKRQAECDHWTHGNWMVKGSDGSINEFYGDQPCAYCPRCGKQLQEETP